MDINHGWLFTDATSKLIHVATFKRCVRSFTPLAIGFFQTGSSSVITGQVLRNADPFVFPSSFAQTGTFAALPGALEIAGSFRAGRQQTHHPQPADEGQRSHQGGLTGLFWRLLLFTFSSFRHFFFYLCFAEVGGERQESSAHDGSAAARAALPEEASGAAGGGAHPHGQHRLQPVLRQVGLGPRWALGEDRRWCLVLAAGAEAFLLRLQPPRHLLDLAARSDMLVVRGDKIQK